MKNIFVSTLFIFVVVHVHAQQEPIESIVKGTRFIGGDMSIYFNDEKSEYNDSESKNNNTYINLGPVVGKYIRENVSVGLYTYYGFSKNNNQASTVLGDYESTSITHSVSAGAFIRKNYKIIPNLFFFLQGQNRLGYGNAKSVDFQDNESKSWNVTAGLGGSTGLQIFLGNKISLETTLGGVNYSYRHTKNSTHESTTNANSIYLTGGLESINFSVRYFIQP